MEKTIEEARENRDVLNALLNSSLPNEVEDWFLDAIERAGVRKPVDELMGHCQRNAVAMRDELRQKDIEAIVVKGWVNDPESHIVPRDFGEAVEEGVVHWWVEARILGNWYTIDLASNARDLWGDLYVGFARPEVYRPAEIEPAEMDSVRDNYGLEPPRGIFDEAR